MKKFAAIDDAYAKREKAAVFLQSIPYDGTSTWGKGSDKALAPFIEASENMELYDIETDSEVYKKGIHILPELIEKASPEKVFNEVYAVTKELLESGKYLTFLGGEHAVSIGIIKAFYERFENLTVLQLDAHADLRSSYNGSIYNHACALHDASKNTNLIQVGIRSMDRSELPFLNRDRCFFAEDMYGNEAWQQASIDRMTDCVYLTIDVDVLDPSIMPSTGTPEPGGLDWNTLICYLKQVFQQRNVVGFDIVELAPRVGENAPNFLVAKLYYKLLSYKFKYDG